MIQPLCLKETLLTGKWVEKDGQVIADKDCERIQALIENVLEKLSTGEWKALYKDPNDGRYWELTYPQSDLHGGGPPQLSVIDERAANKKFDF